MIRGAIEKDMEQCFKLLIESGLHFEGDSETLSKYIGHKYFLVCEDINYRIIGFICGEPLKDNGVVVWYTVVGKDSMRNGIGSLLLHEFCNRNADKQWIYLTSLYSESVRSFYLKNGFKERGGELVEMLRFNK